VAETRSRRRRKHYLDDTGRAPTRGGYANRVWDRPGGTATGPLEDDVLERTGISFPKPVFPPARPWRLGLASIPSTAANNGLAVEERGRRGGVIGVPEISESTHQRPTPGTGPHLFQVRSKGEAPGRSTVHGWRLARKPSVTTTGKRDRCCRPWVWGGRISSRSIAEPGSLPDGVRSPAAAQAFRVPTREEQKKPMPVPALPHHHSMASSGPGPGGRPGRRFLGPRAQHAFGPRP